MTRQFGWDDAAILAGLLLVAGALWLAAGLPAVLGFVGSLLVVLGALVARARKQA